MALGGATQVASMFGELGLRDSMTPALRQAAGNAEREGGRMRSSIGAAALAMTGAL